MKKKIRNIFWGKSAKLNFLLVLAIVSMVGLGCFGSSRSNSKPLSSDYQGEWEGDDGSTISIRSDNSGDYIKAGYKVENASVQLDEKGENLQFKFIGVSAKELKVDQSPSGNSMKLGGVTYKRRGGGSTKNDSNKSSDKDDTKKDDTNKDDTNKDKDDEDKKTSFVKADASKNQMPEDAELQEMAKKALLDFNDAIKQEDFTDFHATISKTWQKQTTPERFKQSFSQFIEKGVDIGNIEPVDADFSPAPYFEKESGISKLVIEGTYPTNRPPVKFVLKYIPQGKEWKLFGIEVDTTGEN